MSGLVVFITGLPSSGKSTLARGLLGALQTDHVPVCVLDGDAVRNCLVPAHGYSEAERRDFYESLARLAALLATQGLCVLIAATANRASYRERARALAPRYFEVYLDTSIEVCRARDSKGLYRASQAGAAGRLPGTAAAPYEPPNAPDFVTSGSTPEIVTELALRVRERLGSARGAAVAPGAEPRFQG